MVLFIDHDADTAREVDRGTGPDRLLVQASELLADQMALVKEETIFRRKLIHPDENPVFDRAQAAECLANLRKNSQALAIPGPRRERVTLEISRQADSRGDDYVRVLARCIEPARAAVREEREIEHYSIPRSLSRMSAASSNCSASIARLSRSRSSVALETCGSSDGSVATYRRPMCRELP